MDEFIADVSEAHHYLRRNATLPAPALARFAIEKVCKELNNKLIQPYFFNLQRRCVDDGPNVDWSSGLWSKRRRHTHEANQSVNISAGSNGEFLNSRKAVLTIEVYEASARVDKLF